MTTDIFTRVADWHCEGPPVAGLTDAERADVIESAQGSYLAEHVGCTEQELKGLDDRSLVSVHYSAMVDASR